MLYLKVPTYQSDDLGTTQLAHRTLGVTSAFDHKSVTQLLGWKSVVGDMFKIFNKCPTLIGEELSGEPADPDIFPAKSVGAMSDHAADQKDLFGAKWSDWQTEADCRLRGKRTVLEMDPIELLQVITEVNDDKILSVGGITAWNSLSEEEQDNQQALAHARVISRIGNDAYDSLGPEEKRIVNLFIHMGCCMHKEMNSGKGGNSFMMKSWDEAEIPGPIKLMNRDNAAAAGIDGMSRAKQRALEVSGAGGVKATSLAGAILNHKDDKKGQHDSLQVFLLQRLGYSVPFPDTSNIRYASHGLAATELITRLGIYKEFLEQVRDKKGSGSFNHMENNLYKALSDVPTLT